MLILGKYNVLVTSLKTTNYADYVYRETLHPQFQTATALTKQKHHEYMS